MDKLFNVVPEALISTGTSQTPAQKIANFFTARRALNLQGGIRSIFAVGAIGNFPVDEAEGMAPEILKVNLTSDDLTNLDLTAKNMGITRKELDAYMARV